MKRLLLCLLFLTAIMPLSAQHLFTWDEFVQYVTDSQDLDENEDLIDHLEDLQQLHLHPININTASKDELLTLPMLDDQQATDIREYVARYHGMKTISELALIRSISYNERQYLPLFLHCGPLATEGQHTRPTLKQMLRQHKHDILSRIDMPFYHRKGFLVKNGYRGRRIYNKNLYTFTATRHLQAFLHTERDAGERGIDSYGGQIILKDLGKLSTFVAGDFRAGFGEGLVINQGFNMGKNNPVARPSQGFRAMRSTDELNFMRGAATTLRLKEWSLSAFFSLRQHDATLDTLGHAKTITRTGYHRTQNEYDKRHNLLLSTVGANIKWQHKQWLLGMTGYYLHSNRALVPGNEYYRRIYPQGSHFGNLGINYAYTSYHFLFKGETAYDLNKQGIATLNTLSYRINSRYRLSLSQRYYSRKYYSFFASALRDNTNVQNETGGLVRLDMQPIDALQIELYGDVFYNPWPRYGVKHSSYGGETVANLLYTFNKRSSLSARYSFKTKEYASGRQNHHRVKAQWTCNAAHRWLFQTTGFLHFTNGRHGEAIGQNIRLSESSKLPLRLSLDALYFHTDGYDTRISLYETNVAGSLSMPSFSGHGTRLAGTLSYQFFKQLLRLELKYGFTWYFDRSTQGSDLQTIYSPYKNDLTLQLRIRI